MRHLVTVEVEGRPASFATAHERAWKDAVAQAVDRKVAEPWPHERFSVRIQFRTAAPTRAGEEWDLDNLIKPTLDAMSGVFGERQWRGVAQPADDRVDHLDVSKRTVSDGEQAGATIEVWAIDDEPKTPPFSRADLEARGFAGFVPFLDLDPKQVPKEAGVYAILRERDDRPVFLAQSRGGHFKGKDPTVSAETARRPLDRQGALHLHRQGIEVRQHRSTAPTDCIPRLRARSTSCASGRSVHLAARRSGGVRRLLEDAGLGGPGGFRERADRRVPGPLRTSSARQPQGLRTVRRLRQRRRSTSRRRADAPAPR